jgi:hypothetical protein
MMLNLLSLTEIIFVHLTAASATSKAYPADDSPPRDQRRAGGRP